ncbi:dienelactone hydrolase family protein [Phenylobacterium sp.]|jgi:carboxymethylenebutenolidase|uniref:dienelactone hydrolase family protein n=1 Tax=Phenylobacterium sp. TaxID=1871053 RepID=UPI0037833054
MAERMNITVGDGSFEAYVAKPAGDGPWPAVVVIQEIFGVNQVMREITDGLAGQGFLAVCPDLFWRIEPGIDITDQTEGEMKRAFELFGAFDVEAGMADIAATIDAVRSRPDCAGKVGAVGFCLGGLLAYLTATRTNADASVSYYGVGIQDRLEEAKAVTRPLMLHIASEDKFVPPEAQDRIRKTLADHPQITIHTYEGQNHAFARMGGEHWDAEAARTAGERSLAFLRQHLA